MSENTLAHTIISVTAGSVADTLGISPGDTLLSINDSNIRDIFDYRYLIYSEQIKISIRKTNGEVNIYTVTKTESDDLGLCFLKPLMDDAKSCQNKCIFCFIDQLPTGLRETLYFKDDDPRLSFLTGNYVTLTNIDQQDVNHITQYHLSPMRISVHAVNKRLRSRMLNNPRARRLMSVLRQFNKAGITLHFQVVLCKGINDGAALDHTIKKLLKLRPGAASLSVVPAGLTCHREGLHPLTPISADDAISVINQVERWQKKCMSVMGSVFTFCADELYLSAGIPIPPYEHYENFPQLENGVGMLALFEHNFMQALYEDHNIGTYSTPICIVTGMAAAEFMKKLINKYTTLFPNVTIAVIAVENRFFGTSVTVSGLLTGRDILNQVHINNPAVLFLPENAFRSGESVMLDGTTLDDLQNHYGNAVKVVIGSSNGKAFYDQLATQTSLNSQRTP